MFELNALVEAKASCEARGINVSLNMLSLLLGCQGVSRRAVERGWRRKRQATHLHVRHTGRIPVLDVRVACQSLLKGTLRGKIQVISVSLSTLSQLLGRVDISRLFERQATHLQCRHTGGIPVLDVRVECSSLVKSILPGKSQVINVSPSKFVSATGPRGSIIMACGEKGWRLKRQATHSKCIHTGRIPVMNVRVECLSGAESFLQGKSQVTNVSMSTSSLLLGRAEVSRRAVGWLKTYEASHAHKNSSLWRYPSLGCSS